MEDHYFLCKSMNAEMLVSACKRLRDDFLPNKSIGAMAKGKALVNRQANSHCKKCDMYTTWNKIKIYSAEEKAVEVDQFNEVNPGRTNYSSTFPHYLRYTPNE